MLVFDIDGTQLSDVANEIGGTEKQVKYALSRALHRTEASLRRMSMRGLPKILALRSASALRKRIKAMKIRVSDNHSEIRLWYGLNDLPVSAYKGKPTQTSSGSAFKGKEYDGAFVAKSRVKGKNTILKRAGKERLKIIEQTYPVQDQAIVWVEDEVFDKTEQVFWGHFRRDLASRVKYLVGRND